MIRFKDFILGHSRSAQGTPSAEVSLKNGQTLYLKFNSKDIITSASYYSGAIDPWLGSLCFLAQGKSISELLTMKEHTWDEAFKEDQTYWDLKAEKEDEIFPVPLELLKAGIDKFRGREYLYQDPEPLICRCFGVRESDVLNYLKTVDEITLEGLAQATKASMGCRSCVPQLNRMLMIQNESGKDHFYKERSRVYWIEEIDYMISCFPEALEWKMELLSFKKNQVVISYDRDVSQREEEEVSLRLQDFLGRALDADLAFFLRRSRQRSKA